MSKKVCAIDVMQFCAKFKLNLSSFCGFYLIFLAHCFIIMTNIIRAITAKIFARGNKMRKNQIAKGSAGVKHG